MKKLIFFLAVLLTATRGFTAPCTLPTIYSMSPTGTVHCCPGGPGVDIQLSGSQVGVTYQLNCGGVPTGSPLSGSGGPLDFGLQPCMACTYTVVGTIVATGCTGTMAGVCTVSPSAAPAAITGVFHKCAGTSTTLGDPSTGGTWSSSNPGCGSITSLTGIVSAIGPGPCTTVITYTLPSGCSTSITFTVDAAPAPISGQLSLCTGTSTPLTDAVGGGTWTSGTVTCVTVNPTGIAGAVGTPPCTSVITYTLADGCTATATVTVTAPCVISGPHVICVGIPASLTGCPCCSWTSSAPATATVASCEGDVTGVSPGSTTITHTTPDGCVSTYTVSVVATPPAASISGGNITICSPGSTALNGSPLSPGNSNWTLTGGTFGSLSTTTGNPTTFYAGSGYGVQTINYNAVTPCGLVSTSITVTVNAAPITGPSTVCVGSNIVLSESSSGTWTKNNGNVNFVGSTTGSSATIQGATPGTTTITFTNLAGCATTYVVNVTAGTSASIANGFVDICTGVTANLIGSPPGATGTSNWVFSGSYGTYTSTPSTAAFTALPGYGVETIYYNVLTACGLATASTTVTVNATPITASSLSVCVGNDITLTESASGSWTSLATGTANVLTPTGSSTLVRGYLPGTATIQFTNAAGCVTTVVVTVNPSCTITGVTNVCVGSTTALGGCTGLLCTWSSLSANATIDACSGVVTGAHAGTATINYTSAGGCVSPVVVNVYDVPVIPPATTLKVCQGSDIVLNTGMSVTWASLAVLTASVNPTTGSSTTVRGVAPGLATITFANPGCTSSVVVTVNPTCTITPTSSTVCQGTLMQLHAVTPITPGTWSITAQPPCATLNPPVLSGASGVSVFNFTGMCPGSYTIRFLPATGCDVSKTITVTPAPVITETPTETHRVCIGSTMNLSVGTAQAGYHWSSNHPDRASVPLINVPNPVVTGSFTSGAVTITYSGGTGTCPANYYITVNALPAAIGGDIRLCVPGSTYLTSQTYTEPTPGTWVFNPPAPTIATLSPPTGISTTVTGAGAGTPTLQFTDNGTGCSTTKLLSVNTLPVAGTIVGSLSSPFCINDAVTLTDPTAAAYDAITISSWTTNPAYPWVTLSGTLPATITVHSWSGIPATIPTWTKLTLTNYCGSVDAIFTYDINSCVHKHVPHPGSLLLLKGDPGLSTALKVNPNPNHGTFTVNLISESDETASIVVTTILGKVVKKITSVTNTENEINISSPAGIYVVTVTTAHGSYVAKVLTE